MSKAKSRGSDRAPAPDYFVAEEAARVAASMPRHVSDALEGVRAAHGELEAAIFALNDAASTHWPTQALGVISGTSARRAESRVPRMSSESYLGRYLARDVRSELNGLVRHVDHITQRITELMRGGQPRRAKLSSDQVAEIREVFARGGVSFSALGAQYGVNARTISRLVSGETWSRNGHRAPAEDGSGEGHADPRHSS